MSLNIEENVMVKIDWRLKDYLNNFMRAQSKRMNKRNFLRNSNSIELKIPSGFPYNFSI